MYFIDNNGITDPRVNLAMEEYALRNVDIDHDYLLFYINEPSIIIGRHQNTSEEINAPYVEEQGIHIVRRISGGGAVYHDLGNLNFSFITRFEPSHFNNYQKFTGPMVEALNTLNVPAELTGRNDVVVKGRKISGNAQFTSKDRMFSHGTLLFDANLDDVTKALKMKTGKFESKGIKSIRSRVANISEFLDQPLGIEQFRKILLDHVFAKSEEIPMHSFSAEDWDNIRKLAHEKYSNWHWNFGESPEFNYQNSRRFPFGEIDVRVFVNKGIVENIKFYGDFFSRREIEELENLFINQPYSRSHFSGLLSRIQLTEFFGDISDEDFLDLFF
ncbi:MAG: lipoate--protein ligase [Calditrichia bacterium]